MFVTLSVTLDHQNRQSKAEHLRAKERAAELADVEVKRLGSGLALLAASMGGEPPSAMDFERVGMAMMREQRGARSLQWVPHVRGADRETFVAEVRTELADFQIWQADEKGAQRPVSFRFHYFPVRWHWPSVGHREVLGYDMGVAKTEREALIEAMVSGHAVVLEEAGATRLVLVQPVYAGPVPEEEAQRRAALRGYLVGTYDLAAAVVLAAL